jgi:S-adenosyl methyltransferase
MDEISMFAELRPTPAADADAIRASVRERVTSFLSEADPAAHGRRLPARQSSAGPRRSPVRRRVLIGAGLVAAAAVAAIAVPAWLPGSGDTVMAKAWAVERNSDGTITIAVSQQFNDPAGLQQALAADGITAFVTMNREVTGVNAHGTAYSYDECDYLNLDSAPQPVQSAVVTEENNNPFVTEGNNTPTRPLSFFANWTWTIDPAALPAGSAVLIPAWRSSDGDTIAFEDPSVLRTDKLPVCTPNTPPPFVGAVPGQPPTQQVTAPTGPSSSASKPLSPAHPNNVHEVAQAVSPASRVVCVDNDPLALARARALLDSDPRPAGRDAGSRPLAQARNSHEFAHLAFAGPKLVPPGVVLVSEWRPVRGDGPRPTPAEVNCYGGVARKP